MEVVFFFRSTRPQHILQGLHTSDRPNILVQLYEWRAHYPVMSGIISQSVAICESGCCGNVQSSWTSQRQGGPASLSSANCPAPPPASSATSHNSQPNLLGWCQQPAKPAGLPTASQTCWGGANSQPNLLGCQQPAKPAGVARTASQFCFPDHWVG